MTKANISEYEELEQRLIEKDAQFREYFTTTGVIGDQKIKDPKKRESQQKKRRRLYQNTQVLMENYQTIVWVVQNFPDTIAEELNEPFEEVDNLIERVDLEFSLENQRLENRIRSIAKSRVLIDRVNEALTMLRTKPGDGEEMYQVIYKTYINPDYKDVLDLFDKLSLSRRRYYYLRENAFMLMSLILWAGPTSEISRWLEIIEMLEEMKME